MRAAWASRSCVRKRVGHRGCAGRRRPKGRFGALRRFGGIGEGGARDWAARVGLRGERGCTGEPVASEGGMLCRSGGINFSEFGLFEHFGPNLENYFQGSFLVLVHIVERIRNSCFS